MLRTAICCFLLLLFFGKVVDAQPDWTLKSTKEGISVYTKTLALSGLKGIKVKCALPATLSQVVALIMDVDAGEDWVYATKSSRLLKKVSSSELFYYSEVDIPWPLNNRDFIAHLTVSQDPKTKVVTIDGPTVSGDVPLQPHVVRIAHSHGKWVLSPSKGRLVQIEYTLEVDPGGTIPVWLVNLFATKGPTETFRMMKKQVQQSEYVNAKLDFIQNP